MLGFSVVRLLRLIGASLAFYLPVGIWFALGITGRLDGIAQDRFDHISGMIILGCSGLFLIIGVPMVLPRAWNGSVPRKRLLKKGDPAWGFLRSIGEQTEEPAGSESSVRMVLEIEIEEPGGRYLTMPESFDVPPGLASLLCTGMKLPLRIDPGNRYRFTVEWSRFNTDLT